MSAPYPVLNKHVPWLVEFAVICFLYEILDKTKCVELSNQRGEFLYKTEICCTPSSGQKYATNMAHAIQYNSTLSGKTNLN